MKASGAGMVHKKDNGGRRRLVERRRYAPTSFFPERRATRFRRSGSDRRRYPADPVSAAIEQREAFKQVQKDRITQ